MATGVPTNAPRVLSGAPFNRQPPRSMHGAARPAAAGGRPSLARGVVDLTMAASIVNSSRRSVNAGGCRHGMQLAACDVHRQQPGTEDVPDCQPPGSAEYFALIRPTIRRQDTPPPQDVDRHVHGVRCINCISRISKIGCPRRR
jgi:hypothetical protein